jgi:hypothetical protein
VLIQAKKNEFLERLDVVDLKDQFESTNCKQHNIAHAMNRGEHVIQLNNVLACKDKWASIYKDFKQITFDYMLRT